MGRHPFQDLKGKRFGKLVAIQYTGKDRHGNNTWLCECDCGSKKVIPTSNLTWNNTRSCGCDKLQVIEKMSEARKKEKSALRKLFVKYKASSKQRGLDFSLELDAFERLTSSPCHYCGLPPTKTIQSKGKQLEYVYNGLDRVSNEIGYVEGNAVPCCFTCNVAKHNHSERDFYEWVKQVYTHLVGDGRIVV